MTINIFNHEKRGGELQPLFLGEKNGLFDTVNKQYPSIWKLYKTMKSLDWDENEFNYSSCLTEFKTCPPSVYDMMIKTLAYQWEADSVASRLSPIVGCVVTNSELWAAWQRISDNEVVHAATYSEIVRSSFDNPKDIIDEVLKVKNTLSRMDAVNTVLAKCYSSAHHYALGLQPASQTYDDCLMFAIAMLCLERIQFMASFAVTFVICDSGMFQPIGKAVQKIAQDELEVHVALDKEIIKIELATQRGANAYERNKDRIKQLVDDVVAGELEWVDYLFSEGRELVGLNADLLRKWTLFCAKDVYKFLGVESDYQFPRDNPLKLMEKWLDISKTQTAPQEQDNGQYKVGVITRTDQDEEFDTNF